MIYVDSTCWDSFVLAPQFIIGKNNEFIPVYIGTDLTIESDNSTIGIYIKNNDYDKIDHTKDYIFVNNPEATYEELKDEIIELKDKLNNNNLNNEIEKNCVMISNISFNIDTEKDEDTVNKKNISKLKVVK
jgi:uncharacterized protein YdgA (DUF945 family)